MLYVGIVSAGAREANRTANTAKNSSLLIRKECCTSCSGFGKHLLRPYHPPVNPTYVPDERMFPYHNLTGLVGQGPARINVRRRASWKNGSRREGAVGISGVGSPTERTHASDTQSDVPLGDAVSSLACTPLCQNCARVIASKHAT